MAKSTAFRNAAVNAVAASGGANFISLHTSDPGTTGTGNEVTGGSYARVATTFPTSTAGTSTGSQVTINVPAGTTITHWGRWTAASGGTFYEGGTLSASEVFGSAGTYLFTPTVSQAA